MSSIIFSIFIFIIFISLVHNLNMTLTMLMNDQMHWNDIVQSEDFIIKALEKLQSDLHITTTESGRRNLKDNLTTKTPTTLQTPLKKIKAKTKKARKVLEILLNGTTDELQTVLRRNVLKTLPKLNNIKVSLDKELILWEIFKNKMAPVELQAIDLQTAETLFNIIPENDLYHLNLTDDDILYYLGTFHGMSRRKAAILAYALKNNLAMTSREILQSNTINSMRGLICGFPSYDLSKINSSVIWTLNDDVLNNLWACNKDQLNVLFEVVVENFQISHVELWNENIVKKLGFLLLIVKPSDMKLIDKNLFQFIHENVFELFGREQLNALTSEQKKHLNEAQVIIYNSKIR